MCLRIGQTYTPGQQDEERRTEEVAVRVWARAAHDGSVGAGSGRAGAVRIHGVKDLKAQRVSVANLTNCDSPHRIRGAERSKRSADDGDKAGAEVVIPKEMDAGHLHEAENAYKCAQHVCRMYTSERTHRSQ
jgi:hypothetical protein